MAEMIIEPIEKYGLSKELRPRTLFSKIGVIGCGRVGQSLVITASKHGIEVVFLEPNSEVIQQSLEQITNSLNQEIDHWGLTPGEKAAILSRIKGTTAYTDFHDCELVIETIKGKHGKSSIEIRKEVFHEIEKVVSKECIIATNSTTIAVTELSSELKHKERCVSLHISTTAPGSNVAELAKGLYTSDESYAKVIKFTKLLELITIPVMESPGLVSVRLFVVILNEACEMLMEGVSSMENIDLTMRSSFNMPLGPFEFADKVGLDKVARWMENLYKEFGSTRYIASPLIKRLVRANRFGRINGAGFYNYNSEGFKVSEQTDSMIG